MTREFSTNGHTQRQWEGKFFRCNARCWYCNRPLVLQDDGTGMLVATKDHLTPLSRGGSDTISNIVPACFDDNRLKGALTEEEFRQARSCFPTKHENSTAMSASSPNSRSGDEESVDNHNLGAGKNTWFRVLDERLPAIREEAEWARQAGKIEYANRLTAYCDGYADHQESYAVAEAPPPSRNIELIEEPDLLRKLQRERDPISWPKRNRA